MTTVVYLAVILGVPVILGLPLAIHPSLARLSSAARAAIAWALGCGILTFVLTLLSAVGVAWTPWWMVLACIAALAATIIQLHENRGAVRVPSISDRTRFSLASLCLAIIAAGGLFTFAFGFATSADLPYFWGVKAAHFALERGVDFELLRQPYMIHLHPNYPPLWPVLLASGAVIVGSVPWLAIPPLTWLCLTATATIIFAMLETRLGFAAAIAVTCLWYAVLTAMMVTSFSGGNAEGLLVLFLSVALAVILTESKAEPPHLRWLAASALAGAVFTKSEGLVAAVLIAAGTAIRDISWRRRGVLRRTVSLLTPAAITAVVWVVVRVAHDIHLTDPIRETAFQLSFDHLDLIVRVCVRILITGAAAIGWLVPLITVVAVKRRSLRRALPATVTAFGIVGFALTYYLHASGEPLQLIVWTLPRLIQPAMSAWILGCGVAVFPVARESHPEINAARGLNR